MEKYVLEFHKHEAHTAVPDVTSDMLIKDTNNSHYTAPCNLQDDRDKGLSIRCDGDYFFDIDDTFWYALLP